MSVTVTARLREETAKKLELLAEHTKRSKSYLIAEAIEQYVKYESEFVAAVLEGIASADRGELIAHEDVMREMYDMIAKHEKAQTAYAAE